MRLHICLALVFLFCVPLMGAGGACKARKTQTEALPEKAENNRQAVAIGMVSDSLEKFLISHAYNLIQTKDADIHSETFDTCEKVVRALEAGDVEFALIDSVYALDAATKGVNLRILAPVYFGGSALVVHDGEVKHPRQLPSMAVAVPSQQSFQAFFLDAYFRKHKLDGRVYIIEMPLAEMAPAHGRREINGFVAPEPFVARALPSYNTGALIYSREVVPDHPTAFLVTLEKTIINRPDVVRAVINSHLDGLKSFTTSQSAQSEFGRFFDLTSDQAGPSMSRIKFNPNYDHNSLKDFADYLYRINAVEKKVTEVFIQNLLYRQ